MEKIDKLTNKALPIIAYGNPVLRQKSRNIYDRDILVDKLIEDLWNTLEISGGVGLAAPQIDSQLNAFVVKSTLMYDELETNYRKKLFCGDKGIEEVFINANILEYSEETNKLTEGCLSIPGISEDIKRPWDIIVEYLDKDFVLHRKMFSGYTARVIQHEFDHTKGLLFIDHLSALNKKLTRNKLKQIKQGKIPTDYPIQYLKYR
ncbi:peptide deformylase [Carboxylicivirga caseinilyticus]|uniref:peptide deformylase n=1 Tax=Carboxylicivirga caseinilyticus TaxID=3417572 RepID=UPI0029C68EA4|nr:peptide deformylase [uncultured Carboxylicivirga sp.]MCU4164337.1 peptide deformylase [Marinilabiliaceae bacterium A049]